MAGGKEIYLGEMLEGMQESMAGMVAAISKLETSNAEVVAELEKVQENTLNLIAATQSAASIIRVKSGEQYKIFYGVERAITLSSSTGTTHKLFDFKSFVDGLIDFKFVGGFTSNYKITIDIFDDTGAKIAFYSAATATTGSFSIKSIPVESNRVYTIKVNFIGSYGSITIPANSAYMSYDIVDLVTDGGLVIS